MCQKLEDFACAAGKNVGLLCSFASHEGLQRWVWNISQECPKFLHAWNLVHMHIVIFFLNESLEVSHFDFSVIVLFFFVVGFVAISRVHIKIKSSQVNESDHFKLCWAYVRHKGVMFGSGQDDDINSKEMQTSIKSVKILWKFWYFHLTVHTLRRDEVWRSNTKEEVSNVSVNLMLIFLTQSARCKPISWPSKPGSRWADVGYVLKDSGLNPLRQENCCHSRSLFKPEFFFPISKPQQIRASWNIKNKGCHMWMVSLIERDHQNHVWFYI